MLRIEYFVAVHYGNEVFGFGEIYDVVCIAGKHDYGLDPVSTDFVLSDFGLSVRAYLVGTGVFGPHLDEAVAFDYDELFPFGVVPMLAFGDAGFGDIDADLSAFGGVEQFSEAASCVLVHLEVEDGFVCGEVAEVCAVELFGEAVCRNFRNHQGLRHLLELVQQVNYLAEGGFVSHGTVAVAAEGC